MKVSTIAFFFPLTRKHGAGSNRRKKCAVPSSSKHNCSRFIPVISPQSKPNVLSVAAYGGIVLKLFILGGAPVREECPRGKVKGRDSKEEGRGYGRDPT